MTILDAARLPSPAAQPASTRLPRTRTYAMCEPAFFDVTYAINPWMDPSTTVDVERARLQWQVLAQTYRTLGHTVDLIDPVPGLPDMVFAANGALTVGDRAYGASFRHAERRPEADAWATWLVDRGVEVVRPRETNEGEGDFLTLAHVVLAGTGFRTSVAAHVECAAAIDRPVVSLELVDPRFYHLDTALAVLDDGHGDAPADIAYVPSAFSAHSRRTLRQLFPDALEVSLDDALVLGLNAVSDGAHVVVPVQATGFVEQLRARGYTPVPIDVSELLKAGGSAKCCTAERHR